MSHNLTLDEVPKYLCKAQLFKNLDIGESFILKYYKEDDTINSLSDLLLYFKVIDYCCLNTRYIALHIYSYIFQNKYKIRNNYEILSYIKKYKEMHFLVNIMNTEDKHIDMISCAMYGYQNAIKILFNNHYPWNEYTCTILAKYGHFKCLKYLYKAYHENPKCHKNFPWNSDVCKYAAAGGHLTILIYAHQHGCPCKADAFTFAAYNNHINCLKYLQEYVFPSHPLAVLNA